MVKVRSANPNKIKPLEARPLCEVSVAPETDTGEDVYFVQENEKHQFSAQISSIYGTKEYFFTGKFKKDTEIKFVHKTGKQIPISSNSNCGYTFVGQAKHAFQARRALIANGENTDDQEYVYVTPYSQIFYVGDEEEHTLFLRIYDNNDGQCNDRWVVVYIK